MKKYFLAVLLSGLWLNFFEFIRNEFLLLPIWIEGFKNIGLEFPLNFVNKAIWGVWGFVLVSILAWVVKKFSVLETTIIIWVMGFVLIWIALGNMGILPLKLLYGGIPLSFIEVYMATLICKWVYNKKSNT